MFLGDHRLFVIQSRGPFAFKYYCLRQEWSGSSKARRSTFVASLSHDLFFAAHARTPLLSGTPTLISAPTDLLPPFLCKGSNPCFLLKSMTSNGRQISVPLAWERMGKGSHPLGVNVTPGRRSALFDVGG